MTSEMQLLIIQLIIVIVLIVIIVLLLKQRRVIEVEKRIGRYSIESLTEESPSFFDGIANYYYSVIVRLRKYFHKSGFLNNMSKRYEKHVSFGKKNPEESMDYIINKSLISLAFILLTIFSQVLQLRVITVSELLIDAFIGFYILDLYLVFRRKRRIKLIENEMLRAIITMNNAFKAGKSTVQALEIAARELPEPICYEFRRMYMEMGYGMTIDVVFERFNKRVNLEESSYLSSSLTILNKTGGNIVKVFNSIEKTLFDKKKLKEELSNLTVSSNLIIKVLLFVPFAFAGIMYLLNPEYFTPLLVTPIGHIVIVLILMIYTLYVVFLQRIMKVKV